MTWLANSRSSLRHNWYFIFELFCHCYILGHLHTFESNAAKTSLNVNIHWKMSFRSKPVFNVTAHLYFEPKEISIENIDCLNNTGQIFQMGTLKTCLNKVEATKSNAGRDLSSMWFLKSCSYWAYYHCFTGFTCSGFSGALKSGLSISCIINVDPMKQMPRGFFNKTDSKSKNHTATYELLNNETCFTYPIYMTVCHCSESIFPLLPAF